MSLILSIDDTSNLLKYLNNMLLLATCVNHSTYYW